jgi:hypothetical protein
VCIVLTTACAAVAASTAATSTAAAVAASLLLLLLLQAERILQLYPEAERVGLQSGHCPHDDTPEEANKALLSWLGRVCKA